MAHVLYDFIKLSKSYKTRLTLWVLSGLFICQSCVRERLCDIKPIAKEIFNLEEYRCDLLFRNKAGLYDTIKFVGYENSMREKEIRSFSNYRECGNVIVCDYTFSNGIPISLRLEKQENDYYLFSINSLCLSKDVEFEDLKLKTLTQSKVVKAHNCPNSNILEMGLKGFHIDYYKTDEGDTWKFVGLVQSKH